MPRQTDRSAVPSAPVSIGKVAERAGVSIATVSRVVNGVAKKASADTVARVREAIDALGYRPMDAGRTLRRGQSRLVALLASNLANPFMAAIAAVAESSLRRAGQVMVLADTHDRADLQDEYLLEMRARYASGFVLLGAVRSRVLAQFVVAGEPMVFVNRRNPYRGRGAHVGIDNRVAGGDVARWFASCGFARPALIHGRLFSSATAERVDGFRGAAADLGLALPSSRISTHDTAEHLQIGYAGMARMLGAAKPPDAVFCTSDLIAYGAQRCAAEHGLRADRDIAFVGFDDSPLNPWIAPWLNAVRVPHEAYGDPIVAALQATAAAKLETILPHELVLRPPWDRRAGRK